MIQLSHPSIDASSHSTAHLTHVKPGVTPSAEMLQQVIFRLPDWSILKPDRDRPLPDPSTLAAMQNLVEMIQSLRTVALASTEPSLLEGSSGCPMSAEDLLPYVSEEAYEVWDALNDDISPSAIQETMSSVPSGSDSRTWMNLEAIASWLLWEIARTSYSVMQMIEGISARRLIADQEWQAGMLRLAILLEIKAPMMHWSFDLVTGCPTAASVDENACLQSDGVILPSEVLTQSGGSEASRDRTPVNECLVTLTAQIKDQFPAINDLLNGISVEILQPGQPWQTGQLQLKIGFEFIDQTPAAIANYSQHSSPDLVEAELVDESTFIQSSPSPAATIAAPARVSLIELPRHLLHPTTLVRLSDRTSFEKYRQKAEQQHLQNAILHLEAAQLDHNPESGLAQIVKEAYRVIGQMQEYDRSTPACLQPESLINELIPKLLWNLTRSSYELTQLIGGVEGRALQPGCNWQSGTLRLLPILHFQTTGITATIDLATGQSTAYSACLLDPKALCQGSLSPFIGQGLDSAPFLKQMVQVEILIEHLLRQIGNQIPEIEPFIQGCPIEWLETGQTWQPGSLKLTLGLELIPHQHNL